MRAAFYGGVLLAVLAWLPNQDQARRDYLHMALTCACTFVILRAIYDLKAKP